MQKTHVLKILDNVITYSFYFLALITPLIFSPSNYELFEFPKMLLVYFGAAFILTLWLIKIILTGRINFAPTPLFFPVLLFLLSQIVSTIISADKITSITGYYSRFHGGLLSTAAFIALYFAAVSNLTKNQGLTLIFLFVISGLISSAWGIPSHFGFDPTCKLLTGIWTSKCWSAQFDPTLRIFSTFGQPNWLAGFLIMVILSQLGLTTAINNLPFHLTGITINAILFWAFLLTNSRSASLALGISIVVFLAILAFVKIWQKVKINFAPLVLTLAIFAILIFFFGQSLVGRVKEVKIAGQLQAQTEAPTIQTAGPTESGQIRLIVWKGALEVWKTHPLTGTGPETFGYSYYNFRPAEHNLTTEWNFLYNKAHNEFLNYLSTTGILGFGSYLAILVVYILSTKYYILNTKKKKLDTKSKILIAGLLAAFLSFLIHNFFGFSVVATSLFFWLILASTILVRVPTIKVIKFKPKPVLIFFPIFFFIFSVYILTKFFMADLNFAKGLSQFDSGNYQAADFYFQNAINLSPLPQPLFLSYAGYNLAILSQTDQSLVKTAMDLTEKSQKLSQVNLTTSRLTANTYLELSSANPVYLEKTIQLANHLLRIAPTDAETHYQAALILKIAGEDREAEKIIKKAIELKPDYQAAIDKLSEWEREKR